MIRGKTRTKIYQEKSYQQDKRNPVSSGKRYANPKAINPQRPRRKFKQETNVWKMVNLRSSQNPHSHPHPCTHGGGGWRDSWGLRQVWGFLPTGFTNDREQMTFREARCLDWAMGSRPKKVGDTRPCRGGRGLPRDCLKHRWLVGVSAAAK